MPYARPITVCLQLLIALNAIGGGIVALSGAPGVPREWLEGSPFSDYTVPGILLFLGATVMIIAATTLILRWRYGAMLSKISGLLLMLWIITQVAIIGLVSWLQPVSFAAGFAITALSFVVRYRELHAWTGTSPHRFRAAH